ncbi:MAG: methyltransferase domain-containing protein [Bacteroidales bacterium]|nr:methyltransferase domain-containing protein [Bacteroidales bacterium]
MHDRHKDREQYFREQALTTARHVIPFINSTLQVNEEISVLEIGCGEGGNLKPFLDAGCRRITGIDISEGKISNARNFYSAIPGGEKVEFIAADIYDSASAGKFDLVMMRDVLEHIHDQKRFLGFVKLFLDKRGVLFIGFPPWNNPFGGHQQMCESRILSKLPWFHLLPEAMYRGILKMFGESEARIEGLLEIKETGINLGWFERTIKKEGFHILKKSLWFINPNFEVKFGLRPRRLPQFPGSIPFLRNFMTTTGYYIISVPPQGH